MKERDKPISRYLNAVLDFILGILALLILVYMVRHLIDISRLVFLPFNTENFSFIMQEITSFFMLFEFVMMLVRYIQEGRHIPIRYLILISVTALLRQLLVIHGEGMQTLLLSLSILLLVVVLYILSKFSESFHTRKGDKGDDGGNFVLKKSRERCRLWLFSRYF